MIFLTSIPIFMKTSFSLLLAVAFSIYREYHKAICVQQTQKWLLKDLFSSVPLSQSSHLPIVMAQSPQLYSAGVAFHLVLYLEQAHQPTRYQPQHFSLGLGSKVFSIYAITCLLLSQYEGAAHEGGKGLSIWDTFTEKHPGPLSL